MALPRRPGDEPVAGPVHERANGGVHADNPVDFQEFMIAPLGASSLTHAIQIGSEVYHELQRTLKGRGLGTAVGDEGGFARRLTSNEAPLELLMSSIQSAGYRPARTSRCASIRPPASSSRAATTSSPGKGRTLSSDEMAEYWATIPGRFPVLFLEDGMAEGDWDGWQKLTARVGNEVSSWGTTSS